MRDQPERGPALNEARTVRRWFSRETRIESEIEAPPERVWSVLTHAPDVPRWNSTVLSLAGEIRAGGRLELVSTLAPGRTFKLRVTEFQPPHRLAWGDAMGRRVFALERIADGARLATRLTMTERIGGPLFPLFARMIPPFDASFERFVADLATACIDGI